MTSNLARSIGTSGGRTSVCWVMLGGMLFGTAGTAQALAPVGATPLGVGTVRLLGGAAVLLGAALLVRRRPDAAIPVLRTKWGLLAGACSAGYQVCFFGSIEQSGVVLGTLVTVASAPVLAGLLSWAVLHDRPNRAWVTATGVCIVGLIMLSADGFHRARPAGVVLGLGAALAMAGYNVAAKRLLNGGAAVLDLLASTFMFGGTLLLPLGVMQPLGWLLTASGATVAIYLGVATMALANIFMAFGLKRLRPGPVTTLTLADPLTATFLGVFLLQETLSAPAVLGLVLVLLGLLLQGATSANGEERPLLAAA